MSHIDFNKGHHRLSALTSNEIKEKLSSLEPSPAPSEEPIQVPVIITDSIQSVYTSNHQLNSIDRNDFYHEVINIIEVMDKFLMIIIMVIQMLIGMMWWTFLQY